MNRKTISRIIILLKPYKKYILLSIFYAVICTAAQLIIPVFCGNAIDKMVDKGNVDFYGIFKAAALTGIAALLNSVLQKFLTDSNNKVAFNVCHSLRDRLSEKINSLPLSYTDTHPTGDTVSRITSDIDTFSDGLLMGFSQLFTGIITIAAILVIMFYLNPFIALAVVILTPLSFFTAKFIASKISRFFREQAQIRGEQTALINELIEGHKVIKEFNYEEESRKIFDEVNNRLEKASMKSTFFSSLTNPCTRLVNNIVYAVVTVISSFFAVTGKITVGQLSVFLNYASQYAKPFNDISSVVCELQNAFSCIERVFEILDEQNEKADPNICENPPYIGEVDIENISFTYNKEKPFIEGLDLTVKPGQKVAIVGPTGCGKTTIINLLMRFYDIYSGCIKVDGSDIRDMSRYNLRSRYKMVLQDTWLCSGTVRDNIAYGKRDASYEEIINAAKSAYAHSFISRLPNGYDTYISENGENLSSGQKQLICIARAMLSDANMLILDEATSSIDVRTEQKIQAAFDSMMKGRTSFIVAHRLTTIKNADIILVMNNGRIIEKGSHSTLMKKNGFYANMYNSR